MQYLTRDNLMGLEQYAAIRPTFRAEVMAHKRDRQVAIGPYATLYFEDRLTMQYQVQEMLRHRARVRVRGDRGRTGGLQSADPGW